MKFALAVSKKHLFFIFLLLGIINAGYIHADTIPKSGWTLRFADSEEIHHEDGRAANAFDDTPAKIWHTQYRGYSPRHPHEIQIDLGQTYIIDGFHCLPDQVSVNGRIAEYGFYVSNDTGNWGTPAVSGSFANTPSMKQVAIPPTPGRFIRFVALSEVNGKPWTSIAEIAIIGTLAGGNQPPNGTIDKPSGNLTINEGDSVDFAGTGDDPDGDLPLIYHWNFGDTAIPQSTDEVPGPIQFNTSGSFTVSFTITDARQLSDPTPAERIITVLAAPPR